MAVARIGTAFLLVLLAWVAPVRASLGLDALETDDLTLVYRDPLQTYLVPHAARCFENALAFHEKLFQFTPSEPMTVLLNDFGMPGTPAPGPSPATSCSWRPRPSAPPSRPSPPTSA
jgi:hypothetical protein